MIFIKKLCVIIIIMKGKDAIVCQREMYLFMYCIVKIFERQDQLGPIYCITHSLATTSWYC